MVLSSNMEGGANVISEATVAGLPVIASDIQGSIGLLGEDFPGYYPVQNTEALRALLIQAENDPSFVGQLKQHGDRQAKMFLPENECQGWCDLLDDMNL
jgi:glycosyltransferase involved in cell wall biosynthesis